MDAKELRSEAVLTERSNDGGVKFALQYDRSKCEVGAGAFKGDTAGARPCAVIGPDRVVLPARDAPTKPAEPWLAPDPGYRRLPDYPYKMSDHKDPTRNISPRQTFQENMQRIIMPPGYNATKLHEDPTFASKNNKLNTPLEVKYCDVPYNINQVGSDQTHIRNADHSANVNPLLMRGVPHGWSAGSVHVRPLRTYGAPDGLQYPDYTNCTGPRPVLTRTHAAAHDDQLYPDAYYHESNIRFKPYPNIKERYPQPRYDYLGNYPNPYNPPNPFAHKYELPKTIPPHSYSSYPQLPKYTERIPEPIMDSYQRTFSQQGNYSVPVRNPVIHSPYRPVPGNHMQNKLHPYPPDAQHKPVPNKLPYDPTSKMYLDYDPRAKSMPISDNYYLNELPRSYHPKNSIVLPNFAPANIHGPNVHASYPLKSFEYSHYKNIDSSMRNHFHTKLPPQFSPSTLAISPADSNASNETAQTHGTSQEDCGYASQSSVTSARSVESLNRIPMDVYGRYDYRYSPIVRASPSTKPGPSSNQGPNSKKDIRQFISSWSEGDDENAENNAKRDGVKTISDDKHSYNKQYESGNNQEQLYVLGLVNVPSEELSKYEHIQKVSKLPENIKGYNSLELLNQFEEAIESSNITSLKTPTPRATQMPIKRILHKHDPVPRALSPLDVESKISQSVIHKEVGCNFEIKPCSPKMLNVEVATPMQTLLNERVIEKVTNPLNVKSPIILQSVDENIENTLTTKTMKCPVPNTASSCKMINSQHLSESSGIDHLKTNYSLQDLESNSGVCLASLPRLDNDIELNFPEVNQQFINANKTDSVITTSFAKDLPALDVNRSAMTSSEYDMNYQFSPKTVTETDFSRLSKYRKLKKCVPDDNDSAPAKAQATRVDSVIIKNPDNTRCLDENADNNTIPEDNSSNDFQDYAMNLVSQTKLSKVDHVVDKMFDSTSSPIASRYDDVSTHSPKGFAMNLSSTSLHKHLNVAEESSRSNVVHAQSEDLRIHNKDFPNRYLERAALDIPMNLSPQAKFSTNGGDDEIKISTRADKTATLDEKGKNDVDANKFKKYEEEKPKNICALSLDKIEDTLIKSPVNLIEESEIKNAYEEPTKKTDVPGNCSSSIFTKPGDIDISKDDYLITHIDNNSNANTMSRDEERNKQINDTNVEKEVTGETNRGDDVGDEKEQAGCNSVAICTDKRKIDTDNVYKNYNSFKKYDRFIAKSKRKKIRTENRRKRCFEKMSANIANANDNKDKNLTELHNTGAETPTKQSTNREPRMTHGKEDNIISDSNSINEIIKDNVKITNVTNLGDNSTKFTADIDKNNVIENSSDENILQNDPDIIKNSIIPSCIQMKDKCLAILPESGTSKTPQNNLAMDIDSGSKTHYGNCTISMQPKPILDYQLERKGYNNDPLVRNWKDDKKDSEIESSLHSNVGILLERKGMETPLFLDQPESQNERKNAYLENEDVDRQVILDINDKKIKESMTEVLNFDTKKVDEIGESVTNETISRESKPLENKELAYERENITEDFQIQGLLKSISSKNEDHSEEYPLFDKEVNRSTPRSECLTDTLNQDVTNNGKDIKEARRPHVKKELFSSRFQNLIICNEIIDICPSADELNISDDKHLSLGKIFYPVTQDQIPCVTEKTRINTVGSYTKVSDEEKVNLNLSYGFDSNIINETGTFVECNKQDVHDKTDGTTLKEECVKDILSDETNGTNAEHSILSSGCDVRNDLGGFNENYNNNRIENPLSEIQFKTYDETQILTVRNSLKRSVGQFVTNSPGDVVSTECDEYIENKSCPRESDLPISNMIESDTCATNIIVVDETASVSPEHSEVDAPVVNNYEFNKKIQPFAQSLNATPRFSLKRSLSDSALNAYDDDVAEGSEKNRFVLPRKRKKCTDIAKIEESHLLKIIQSSRRNSISTLNENFSFCILIDDNCIVAGENYEQDNFVQIESNLLHQTLKDPVMEEEKILSPAYNLVDENERGSNNSMPEYDEEKAWVEDVGCEETIETEDIAENIVIGDPASPKDAYLSDSESDDESMDVLNNEALYHTNKVKHIYGNNMCTNDAQLVDALYRTPQMDVNKKLLDRESHITDKSNKCYDSDSLEMLLAEPVDNIPSATAESSNDYTHFATTKGFTSDSVNKENNDSTCIEVCSPEVINLLTDVAMTNENNIESKKSRTDTDVGDKTQDRTIHSCESSLDNVFSYMHKENSSQCSQTTSSSPEVSSTTSEEKSSCILLKISNFKGSRISEVKSLSSDKHKDNNCKIGGKEYLKSNCGDGVPSNRPLRTKAAQKYIPPLRESIPDLKVKLALPQQSLLKFQKHKVAKEEPKLSTRNIYSNYNNNLKLKNEIPRKNKPKFEDVLKNIDEAQFQMHKEKNKKAKKYIPKVVIKKSENGSHYASTSTKEAFNPDLTGRKWQPWVFIEKNKFIDDMALKNKCRAVFSHRRQSFVLAEKFCKYKSISSAKFVISQPKLSDFSTGNLKYTIKLKHGY